MEVDRRRVLGGVGLASFAVVAKSMVYADNAVASNDAPLVESGAAANEGNRVTEITSFRVDPTPLTASDVGAYSRADVDDAIEAAKNGPILTAPTLTSPRLASAAAPASANSPGVVGQVEWDSEYFYICIQKNTWRRTALQSW